MKAVPTLSIFTKRFTLAASVALFAVTSTLDAKEIFRWVDENGEIHYSDKKPAPQQQKDVESMVIGPSKSTGSDSRTRALENAGKLDERKKKELEAKAERLQAKNESQQRDSMCQKARDNLSKIALNARIKITGENGELRYLSQEEVEAKKKQYQEIVDASC